ncbi:6-phosphogluconolactonase [Brachybacterium phenoliresistens]|uniref:6-phosphogluconolactonase n=1 Tax=Brachybacterium phenoliresistens TaxID=396014 RepID=Z9JXP8_9MICO|nr:6-phosphogluconolactonase [Brachybacterium phenoliresistens]EWS82798.1 6-phosphogluconolactonase [Brachybacterium phenoliresistens]
MITTLTDTTASAIDKKMTQMRETFGANTIGRVLTLLIVATGEDIDAPLEAAVRASHEHPSRVIVVDADRDAEVSGLDAEIRVGRDAGAGEIIILRARGEVMANLDTLIMPLLLPDAPIVTWWPENAPSSPVHDVLGSMSQRRITDALACGEPTATLKRLRRGYSSGDSDLAWARLTNWRGLVATAYEVPPATTPDRVVVTGRAEDPSVVLLASWLELSLGTEVRVEAPSTDAPGVQGIVLHRAEGTVSLRRENDDSIVLTLPGDQAGQHVAMPERSLYELLAEELRRLDPDEVYGDVLSHAYSVVRNLSTYAKDKPAPTDAISADADAVAADAAAHVAARLREAIDARGVAHLVLTGGTVGVKTALALPDALAAAGVDTGALHLWWGDERFVEAGHPDRNDAAVQPAIEALGLPAHRVHRMPATSDGMSLDESAAWYGQQLDLAGGDAPFRTRGQAFFDVILLGMGPDGHIASLFPEHPAQQDVSANVIPVRESPKPPAERISLTWPVVNSARHVALLVAGAEKAAAVARGHGEIDPTGTPASAVRGLESTTWFLDEAAAAELPPTT